MVSHDKGSSLERHLDCLSVLTKLVQICAHNFFFWIPYNYATGYKKALTYEEWHLDVTDRCLCRGRPLRRHNLCGNTNPVGYAVSGISNDNELEMKNQSNSDPITHNPHY